MTPSPTITLFSQRIDSSNQPASVLASILIHCCTFALLWLGIAYTPQLNSHVNNERYTVRKLDLLTPDQQQPSSKGAVRYPGPRRASSTSAPRKPETRPQPMTQVANAQPGPQTLIQPDVPDPLTLTQPVPVPRVVLWQSSKTPVKDIVAPLPKEPTASDVPPSPARPNKELSLSDVDLSASEMPSQKLQLLPSTSSPVVVHRPELTQLPPQTVSQTGSQPTPAAVVSLSDLQIKNGSITLPPINETVRTPAPGELAATSIPDSATPGKKGTEDTDTTADTDAVTGTGEAQATPDAVAAPRSVANASIPEGQPSGANSSRLPSPTDTGNGQSDQASATPITLPRNGRFGAVVVGDSMEDQFPELAGLWNGRMAYTVYLHVGLARSWILQYCLPLSVNAGEAGITSHVDAPWPYNIVRPNLNPGSINTDALMIHGFVNQSGRFEALSMVFPESFSQAQFVLASLEQWQFRPAMQNGQSAKVEVLLIIPEQLE